MSKYLYGVSIQGIQEFIFKTNKLKEIIGASKIVEDMDSIKFKKDYDLKDLVVFKTHLCNLEELWEKCGFLILMKKVLIC